jgi:hypothetical protein
VARALVLSLGLLLAACTDSKEYNVPGPTPTIVSASGPRGSIATCNVADGGGSCPLTVHVVFRLAEGSFVTKAILRFEGDQVDTGVDHAYVVPPTYGKGATDPDGGGANDVGLDVNASIPSTIVRAGANYTYNVRLVTGAGDESAGTTLTVSIP